MIDEIKINVSMFYMKITHLISVPLIEWIKFSDRIEIAKVYI